MSSSADRGFTLPSFVGGVFLARVCSFVSEMLGTVLSVSAKADFNFNYAGAFGRQGPTQSQVNSAYAGSNLENSVTITSQGIQEWTVPASGLYRIEARGAMGGGTNGGKGAVLAGDFILNGNEVIKVIVGQTGTVTNQGTSFGAGGGGGSYVYRNSQSALIIAAGGGGQAENSTGGAGSATEPPPIPSAPKAMELEEPGQWRWRSRRGQLFYRWWRRRLAEQRFQRP